MRITNCGTCFPQRGAHRAGKGVVLLVLVLTAKKKQPALPGTQRTGWRRHTISGNFPFPFHGCKFLPQLYNKALPSPGTISHRKNKPGKHSTAHRSVLRLDIVAKGADPWLIQGYYPIFKPIVRKGKTKVPQVNREFIFKLILNLIRTLLH